MRRQPTANEITINLYKVLEGKLQRSSVADWAMEYIRNDDVEVNNISDWDLLKLVGSLDLFSMCNEYLYTNDDILAWINEYKET